MSSIFIRMIVRKTKHHITRDNCQQKMKKTFVPVTIQYVMSIDWKISSVRLFTSKIYDSLLHGWIKYETKVNKIVKMIGKKGFH
jgi:hypothetical protein